MIRKVIDGNKVVSDIAYKFTEVSGIYPITPATSLATEVDKASNNGVTNIFGTVPKVIQMQSEAGAISVCHGALESGSMATTFTSSQGLLLMIPTMYKIAGSMLPSVIHVPARTVATHALSIFSDHSDVYTCLNTGYVFLASSSVEEAGHMALIAHLSTYKIKLPILHFYDGFRTSNEINTVNTLEYDDYKHLIDFDKINEFKQRSMINVNPTTRGTAQNDDVYFPTIESRNTFYENAPDIINEVMNEVSLITGNTYKPFVYYGANDATRVIITLGSSSEVTKEVVDDLNSKGEKVGLITVHLFKPFSTKYLLEVLPSTAQKIACLDRCKDINDTPELYKLVSLALKDTNIDITSGIYGLSSRDTQPSHIKAVFDMLNTTLVSPFTIGIDDDVTNRSLKIDNTYFINNNTISYKIFGYGSDGMISASKSLLNLASNSKYVQGYFQYDSKKSGGVTISHLRFSDDKIKSTYYVDNPKVVICSKESYLGKINMLHGIENGGTFILNTIYNKDEITTKLPKSFIKELKSKNINFYTINCYEIASHNNLGNKISTTLLSAILYITELLPHDEALTLLEKSIKDMFSIKGIEVVKSNIDAIKSAKHSVHKIDLNTLIGYEEEQRELSIYETIGNMDGYSLKVSDLANNKDGVFAGGNTKLEKRNITNKVPCFNSDNCIQCNYCSLVCPHAVIRPSLINEEEYSKLNDSQKKACKKAFGPGLESYYFTITVSEEDCTGCAVCTKMCPGKMGEKALVLEDITDNKERAMNNEYFINNISYKRLNNDNFSKFTQFRKPLFEFSGACAGCGETAYIKLLTQLFEEKLVIANATGCSSIYGASMPSFPYSVPWINSLFENNAEMGLGIANSYNFNRNNLINLVKNKNYDNTLITSWLNNPEDITISRELYNKREIFNDDKILKLSEYILPRSIWCVGGDGWAYDIGFSGIDHIFAQNTNINILVLDTEVYSNTGGQVSKSTKLGTVAQFASSGKKTNKKDLARIALSYDNVYVASVSLGHNREALVKALKEAESYDGPSIVIAYTPCISHGIKGGMENSVIREAKAVECGYFNAFRYNPLDKKLTMDQPEPKFELLEEFVLNENRYRILNDKDNTLFKELLEEHNMYNQNRYKVLSTYNK